MIKHHLSDNMIRAYAAGQLPEAFNLIVATHISLCDECRAALSGYESLGGAILESSTLADTAMPSLNATMQRIKSAASTPSPQIFAAPPHNPETPRPLAAYIGSSLDDVNWKPLGMGVRQSILATSAEATARMLYIPAGITIPDHGHHGTELTLVLRGAYSDENDRFERGDIELADQDLHHTPIADTDQDCICLAVTDAPLKFKNLLPRLMQPLFGI